MALYMLDKSDFIDLGYEQVFKLQNGNKFIIVKEIEIVDNVVFRIEATDEHEQNIELPGEVLLFKDGGRYIRVISNDDFHYYALDGDFF